MTCKKLSLLPLLAALLFAPAASAKEEQTAKEVRKHALSLIGSPKYPAGFKHFDYVNPDAPKGGSVRRAAIGSFDTLNNLANKGNAANGLGLIYDSLMDQSADQPSTSYCLLCEWVSYPEDFSSVTFKLREGTRWHDGKPLTVEDVIFSFKTLTANLPFFRFYYKDVDKVEKTGERLVTFRLKRKNNREIPTILGDLFIVPKHYWSGKKPDGEPRDTAKSSLEIPLGSGPYRIKTVARGSKVVFERVKDYWAKDLPVQKGRYNFDEITYTYYKDDTVALEAFKAGDIDYRLETSSKNWASAYDFPAHRNGQVTKREIELKTSEAMQAFVMNIRRSKFSDPLVRRAFNLAFNYEWANKNLFFGQYRRISSYFERTELACTGLPEGLELEILKEVKGMVPEEVFTKPHKQPRNSDPRQFRKNLRKAARLLRKAGWSIKNGVLTNSKTGAPFKLTFLLLQASFERIVAPYVKDLRKLGIQAEIRKVDSAQFIRRLRSHDFDIVVGRFRQSHSPGNEQRDYWSSAAADKQGSRNIIGIKNKAVDKLIDRIIFARNRKELVAATRALDRVLLWNHYVVPQWYAPKERVAHWNKFGWPKVQASQDVGFLTTWWIDDKLEQKLATERN